MSEIAIARRAGGGDGGRPAHGRTAAAFVGRAAELELFRGALEAPEPPFSVLWVHGPGRRRQDGPAGRARRRPRPTPGREPRAARPARDRAVTAGVPRRTLARGAAALAARDGRCCCSTPSSAPARSRTGCATSFVPALPAGALVVIAGRAPPGDALARATPAGATCCGWSRCATSAATTRARCCARAGVADDLHDAVARRHPRPPAGAVAAASTCSRSARRRRPARASARCPTWSGALVASFLAGVPSPRHRLRARGSRRTRRFIDRRPAARRVRRRRGRAAVRVAARPVVRRGAARADCARTTSRATSSTPTCAGATAAAYARVHRIVRRRRRRAAQDCRGPRAPAARSPT